MLVTGPDDLVPAPDRGTAAVWADRVNTAAQLQAAANESGHAAVVHAVVANWPYSADQHTEGPSSEYAWLKQSAAIAQKCVLTTTSTVTFHDGVVDDDAELDPNLYREDVCAYPDCTCSKRCHRQIAAAETPVSAGVGCDNCQNENWTEDCDTCVDGDNAPGTTERLASVMYADEKTLRRAIAAHDAFWSRVRPSIPSLSFEDREPTYKAAWIAAAQAVLSTRDDPNNHPQTTADRNGLPDFRAHLDGRVRWVETVNPQRGARLRRLFDAVAW